MSEMKKIFKYKLTYGSFEVELPQYARILSVGVQGGDIVIWAEVDSNEPNRYRSFRAIPTGGNAPDEKGIHYFDTVFMDSLVFHIYFSE